MPHGFVVETIPVFCNSSRCSFPVELFDYMNGAPHRSFNPLVFKIPQLNLFLGCVSFVNEAVLFTVYSRAVLIKDKES